MVGLQDGDANFVVGGQASAVGLSDATAFGFLDFGDDVVVLSARADGLSVAAASAEGSISLLLDFGDDVLVSNDGGNSLGTARADSFSVAAARARGNFGLNNGSGGGGAARASATLAHDFGSNELRNIVARARILRGLARASVGALDLDFVHRLGIGSRGGGGRGARVGFRAVTAAQNGHTLSLSALSGSGLQNSGALVRCVHS